MPLVRTLVRISHQLHTGVTIVSLSHLSLSGVNQHWLHLRFSPSVMLPFSTRIMEDFKPLKADLSNVGDDGHRECAAHTTPVEPTSSPSNEAQNPLVEMAPRFSEVDRTQPVDKTASRDDAAQTSPAQTAPGPSDETQSPQVETAPGSSDVSQTPLIDKATDPADAIQAALDNAAADPDVGHTALVEKASDPSNDSHTAMVVTEPDPPTVTPTEPGKAASDSFTTPHTAPVGASGPPNAAASAPVESTPDSSNVVHAVHSARQVQPLNPDSCSTDDNAADEVSASTIGQQSSGDATDMKDKIEDEQGNVAKTDQRGDGAPAGASKHSEDQVKATQASAVVASDNKAASHDQVSDGHGKKEIPVAGKQNDSQKSAGRGRSWRQNSAESKMSTTPSSKRFISGAKKESEPWKVVKDRYLHMESEQKRLEYRCGRKYYEYNAANFPDAFKPADQKTLRDKVAVWRGDITALEFDAIVNAANERMRGGGGVDGAIHSAAGPFLVKESIEMYPHGCDTGDAKITGGYKLPAKYVIHTVGPRDRSEKKLTKCYESVLDLVVKNNINTVAIPCISTGIFGYPNDKAAIVAVNTVHRWLKKHLDFDGLILFCVFLDIDDHLYHHHIPEIFSGSQMDTHDVEPAEADKPADVTSGDNIPHQPQDSSDVDIPLGDGTGDNRSDNSTSDSSAVIPSTPNQNQQVNQVADNNGGFHAMICQLWGRCNIL